MTGRGAFGPPGRWLWALLGWTAVLAAWFAWLVVASPLDGNPLATAVGIGPLVLWFVGLAVLGWLRRR